MKTITNTRRTGVNQLALTLSDGTRRLLTGRLEIKADTEGKLPRVSRMIGIRAACAGIGRISRNV